jgi:hypothetical protein
LSPLHLRAIPAALACLFLMSGPAPAQPCDQWTAGPLDSMGFGANGPVHVMMDWDHDGLPATPRRLVVGGRFNWVGVMSGNDGVAANNIAMWDGAKWYPLGAGVNNANNTASVRALAVYNGELIVGGIFTQAGTVTMDTNIARWNGSSWQTLGSSVVGPSYTSMVHDLDVYNGQVVIASINYGNGLAIAVRTWHSSLGWGSLGGFSSSSQDVAVYALAVLDGRLFAGGRFQSIGGVAARNLAVYNGSAWEPHSPLGVGPDGGSVKSLVTNPYSPWILMGGQFSSIGESPANNLALVFTGGAAAYSPGMGIGGVNITSAVAIGPDPARRQLAVGTMNGEHHLLAAPHGGTFEVLTNDFAGSAFAVHVHDPVPTSLGDEITVVGGMFTIMTPPGGNLDVNNIVEVPAPGQFRRLHHSGSINAMVAHHTGFIAAGDFTHPVTGDVAHNLIRWNGTSLSAVTPLPDQFGDEGTNGPVHALRATSSGLLNRNLYIGGEFTAAGGVLASRIVRYATNTMAGIASFNAMGPGFNNTVLAIEQHANQIYAGGMFTHSGTTPVNFVARWNASTSLWEPLAQGLNGIVFALRSYNGELYAGGLFTFSGAGAVMPRIARWNGTAWTNVGGAIGVNGPGVFALTVFNNELYATGDFTGVAGVSANSVAKWNGTNWTAVGSGLTGIVNTATVSPDSQLIIGGRFVLGGPTYTVARLNNNTWEPLNLNNNLHGHADRVYALGYRGADLQAGGQFRFVHTDLTPNWAVRTAPCPPCMPDVNGNGAVDVDDLIAVVLAWGTCPAPPAACPADVNASGAVDVDDLIAVILAWGACP